MTKKKVKDIYSTESVWMSKNTYICSYWSIDLSVKINMILLQSPKTKVLLLKYIQVRNIEQVMPEAWLFLALSRDLTEIKKSRFYVTLSH